MPAFNRLHGMTYDEVSAVDEDANGHAKIVITKSRTGEGDQMPRIYDNEPAGNDDEFVITDADGNAIDLDDLEVGTEITDPETGQRFVVTAQDEIDEVEDQGYQEQEDQRELVGAGEVGKRISTRRGVSKSLGDTVLEQLTAALSTGERDTRISKAFDVISKRLESAEQRATDAEMIAKQLIQDRELEAYARISEDLGVPADSAEVAQILSKASRVLNDKQLDVLEHILGTAGTVAKYDEIGVAGAGQRSDTYEAIVASSREIVTKRNSNVTEQQARVALFEANPDAYDDYNTERGI